MRFFVWLARAFIFFALFAFALNNQQAASVHWFFGYAWSAPMVIIVLAAFAGGTAFGVLAMTPSWWNQRRLARRIAAAPANTQVTESASEPAREPIRPVIPDGV